MSEDIEKELLSWAQEALELRHGEAGDPEGAVRLPTPDAGLYGPTETLQRIRTRLDRVEELQSKARQAKGRIMRMRENAAFEAQLAFDQAMQQQGATRSREYVTGLEKSADASLASLGEKREAHRLKQVEALATEVLDVVSQCYWGLEKLREDVLHMHRFVQYINSLEYQT